MEAETLTWGLELRGKVGCFSWKRHSLGESAGRASSVSTEDVICYISEFVCVMFMSHVSSVGSSRVGFLMQEMPCSDRRAV